jgi:hypothetical protein
MTFTRIVLLGSTAVFGVIGVGFMLFPQVLSSLVGIALTDVTADNDFRAVYGGVPAGLAVFLVLALRRREWELPALYVVLLTLGGLAASRVLSWLIAGWPAPIAFGLHGMEVSGIVLTTIAIRIHVRDTRV